MMIFLVLNPENGTEQKTFSLIGTYPSVHILESLPKTAIITSHNIVSQRQFQIANDRQADKSIDRLIKSQQDQQQQQQSPLSPLQKKDASDST